jgi:hypothetical protein
MQYFLGVVPYEWGTGLFLFFFITSLSVSAHFIQILHSVFSLVFILHQCQFQ